MPHTVLRTRTKGPCPTLIVWLKPSTNEQTSCARINLGILIATPMTVEDYAKQSPPKKTAVTSDHNSLSVTLAANCLLWRANRPFLLLYSRLSVHHAITILLLASCPYRVLVGSDNRYYLQNY